MLWRVTQPLARLLRWRMEACFVRPINDLCQSARGLDADLHVNILILKDWPGSKFHADSHL